MYMIDKRHGFADCFKAKLAAEVGEFIPPPKNSYNGSIIKGGFIWFTLPLIIKVDKLIVLIVDVSVCLELSLDDLNVFLYNTEIIWYNP